ncbi:hypothetical protein [Amycolatopsis sp. lyj-90]|uniref:hypothetical protein n=1 Tax=Amycolatopsis sp. lyj-90 TaxID=2789285 RepID=UPI00397B7767
MVELAPVYRAYKTHSHRVIPVVVLDRVAPGRWRERPQRSRRPRALLNTPQHALIGRRVPRSLALADQAREGAVTPPVSAPQSPRVSTERGSDATLVPHTRSDARDSEGPVWFGDLPPSEPHAIQPARST